jgi:protease-4
MMRLLKGIWRVLSGISRAISVLVPLLFVTIFVIAFSTTLNESTPEPLPERAALLIAPSGPLVEDSPPVDTLSAFINQDYDQPVLLNDVVRSIRWAATDERITSLVFDLENLAGPSTSQTLEISSAIEVFRASGKPVIAAGDFYSQAHYLLASQADHILLHPEGGMFLEGFSVYRSYLRSFLEKTRVTMHVFRAGENKSAVEPYLRDDMSDEGARGGLALARRALGDIHRARRVWKGIAGWDTGSVHRILCGSARRFRQRSGRNHAGCGLGRYARRSCPDGRCIG